MPFDPNQPVQRVRPATPAQQPPAFDPAAPIERAQPQADAGPGLIERIGQETFRTLGGAARDAVQAGINAPADLTNLVFEGLGQTVAQGGVAPMDPDAPQVTGPFRRPPQLEDVGIPEIEQPESMFTQLLRGVLPVALPGGAIASRVPKATSAGAPLTAATRGGIGGSIADLVFTDPESGNLSNLVIEASGDDETARVLLGGLAKNPDDPPALNRLRDVLEGGGLGATAETVLSYFLRAGAQALRSTPDAAPDEIYREALADTLVGLDDDTRRLLEANGVDLSAPENAEMVELARGRLAERRSAEAGRAGLPREVDRPSLAEADAEIDAGLVDPGFRPTQGFEPERVPETLPVDAQGQIDTGNAGTRAGADHAAAVRAKTREEAVEAFRIAEARRGRVEDSVTERVRTDSDAARTADPRAGGRPQGRGADERFVFVDPVVRDGQMVSGRQAEIAGSVEMDGQEFYGVRFVDDGELAFVEPGRLQSFSRPAEPRMSQEFSAASRQPPAGVAEETTIGPRRVTDQVQSTQVAGLRGEAFPPDGAARGANVPPRGGGTIDDAEFRDVTPEDPRGTRPPDQRQPGPGEPVDAPPPVRVVDAPDPEAGTRRLDELGATESVARLRGDAARARPGTTLLSYLKGRGGLLPDDPSFRGELRARDFRHGLSGVEPGILSARGQSLDDATLSAWEAGYFPNSRPGDGTPRPSVEELLDLIDQELGGSPVFSRFDDASVRDFEAEQALDRDLDRILNEEGIDLRTASDDEIADAIERAVRGGGDPEDIATTLEDAQKAILRDLEDEFGPDVFGPDDLTQRATGPARTLDDLEAEDADIRDSATRGRTDPQADKQSPRQAAQGRPEPGGDQGSAARSDAGRTGDEGSAEQRAREEKGKSEERLSSTARQDDSAGPLFSDARDQKDINDLLDGAKDPKLREAADGIRTAATKLYSNPIADLDVWKGIVRDMLGWSSREAEKWVKQWERVQHLKSEVPKTRANPLASFARMVLWTNDGQMRSLARIYKSDAINDIADMFHARAGEARGAGRTFDEEVSSHLNARKNEFAKVIGEDWLDDVAKMKQLRNRLTSTGPITGSDRMSVVARGIRKLLDQELDYLRDAGVDVGRVPKGYFPRQPDIAAITTNPDGFLQAASRVYVKMGMARKDAMEAAEAWRERILFEDASDGSGSLSTPYGGTPNADFMKGRVLPKEADDLLADYLLQDTPDVLSAYFSRAGRRAAWARRFGRNTPDGPADEKWQELVQRIRDDGAEEALPDLVRNVQIAAGTHPWGLSQKVRNGIGWARIWNTFGLLEHATLTSISEIAMPAIRAGRPQDLLRGIAHTVSDLARGNKMEARALAEDLGLIVNGMHDSIMAGRFATLDPESRSQAQVLDAYFRRTGLEQFTRATRVASMRLGQTFIRRMAIDAADGNKAAKVFMSELGLDGAKIDSFARWLKKTNDGLPGTADLAADTGNAKIYRTALMRFMDQSVMRPGTSTRPNWASHPVGGLVFQLQSFIYAFQKNVLNRSAKLAKMALTEKDLSAGERAQLLAPAAMLPVLAAIQAGIGEGRDRLFASKEWTAKRDGIDKFFTAVSRSGLTGVADTYINLFTGVRYNRSTAQSVAGPLLGRVTEGVDEAIKLRVRNSENTNTAERNAAIAAYDLGLEPTLNFMLSRYVPPGASQLGAAAITQGIGSKKTRDEVVSWIAGDQELNSGPRARGGRSNSRGNARGNSR